MDFDALAEILARIHRGELTLVSRDTPEPSPLAHEILNARPYSFLDDAPLEERRTQAVYTRRVAEPSGAGHLGALDQAAIDRVRDEARPDPRNADELHDALLTTGYLTGDEAPIETDLLTELVGAKRAARVRVANRSAGPPPVLVAAERLPEFLALHPAMEADPPIQPPGSRTARVWTRDEALVELLRGRLTILGPTTTEAIARSLAVGPSRMPASPAHLNRRASFFEGISRRDSSEQKRPQRAAVCQDSRPATRGNRFRRCSGAIGDSWRGFIATR